MDCQHKQFAKLDVIEGTSGSSNQIVRVHQYICAECGRSEAYEQPVLEPSNGPQNHPVFKQLEAQLAQAERVVTGFITYIDSITGTNYEPANELAVLYKSAKQALTAINAGKERT